MGRRFVGVLAACAAAAALAGCTSMPLGVDGNLTNAWPAMPVAKVSVPVAGVCYAVRSDGIAYGDVTTTPCTDTHLIETVYVGTFTGADADRSSAPDKGSQALVTTFGECRKNASTYLGDDYDMGLMVLGVTLPTASAWKGGARWYRCDINQYTDLKYTTAGTGSVKDGLRGDRRLAITCMIVSDSGTNGFSEDQLIPCAQPHNAELAGLFTAPNVPWPSDQKTRTDIGQKGCESVVAQYLGLSGGRVSNPVLGWGWDGFAQEYWEMGDRTTRCLAMGFKNNSVNGVRFRGSVKGIGSKAPKA